MPTKAKTHRPHHAGTAKDARERRKDQGRAYDKTRPNAASRGYTYKWSQAAARYKSENPLCVHCLDKGLVRAVQHVDHIKRPPTPDHPLFWDRENWQSLCATCHGVKTLEEQKNYV